MKMLLGFACWCGALVFVSACSHSNNLVEGRVEATVGNHKVVVTDCYRTRVPQPDRLEDTAEGQPSYRFTPCRDADVLIRGGELWVNSRAYGHLNPNDGVLVDHGVVSVDRR